MTNAPKTKRPSLISEFRKSKTGLVGFGIIIVLVAFMIYSLVGLPPNLPDQWNNGPAWVLNPQSAPPVWFAVLTGNYAPSATYNLNSWGESTFSLPGNLTVREFSSSVEFSWSSNSYPQNFALVPQFQGNISSISITWTKPGGSKIQTVISNPDSGQAYEAQSVSFTSSAAKYVYAQTGKYYTSLERPQIVTAFFGKPGPGILNSSVAQGSYQVDISIISIPNSRTNMSDSQFVVIGNAYGTMGTDVLDRPIDLGLVAGLPNALEIGFLVAIVAVMVGVIFGGISGFLGGRKDGILQWFTLVILALPALPFLVVMSFVIKLTILFEVFLIAALSWPFYAIIARTVALSVKSQTFVEADKAMGISSSRSFFSHIMPRLVPVTIAYSVLGIPAGILLAQTLAFIGIVPPNLITWGTILSDAFTNNAAVFGFWWWVVFPGLMIVVTAVPFVLIGFALERIIAPRVAAK